ncbi:endonuclease domain-containing protein [Flavobacterium sp.]|uniref:endonuclease domain-containing protein n=1 Tax=Flavobacterium sp. TaxID=239 RepID=UPI00262061B5|nr:endonuclease domain-containing protein [Flavobacterium sp.]
MKNKTIPYPPHLREYAKYLRNNSTLSEVLLWKNIKNKGFDIQFHRQVPMDNFIVDFYCHEIMLAIEIDGNSHDFKYDYDSRRQAILESYGVCFLRFTDADVKNDMFSVLLSIEQTIELLLTENTPE